MKRTTQVLSSLAAFAVAVGFISPAPTSAQERADGEKAIRRVLAAAEGAFNEHDPVACSMIFHPAAELTNPLGQEFQGRAALEAYYRSMFSGSDSKKDVPSFKDSRVTNGKTAIRFIRTDVATVDLRYTMTGVVGPYGKAWGPQKGLLTLVMTKEGGIWGITSNHVILFPELPPGVAVVPERRPNP